MAIDVVHCSLFQLREYVRVMLDTSFSGVAKKVEGGTYLVRMVQLKIYRSRVKYPGFAGISEERYKKLRAFMFRSAVNAQADRRKGGIKMLDRNMHILMLQFIYSLHYS